VQTREYSLIILAHIRVQNVQTREYNYHIKNIFVHATHNVVPFASTRELITSNTITTHLSCFCMINGVFLINCARCGLIVDMLVGRQSTVWIQIVPHSIEIVL